MTYTILSSKDVRVGAGRTKAKVGHGWGCNFISAMQLLAELSTLPSDVTVQEWAAGRRLASAELETVP